MSLDLDWLDDIEQEKEVVVIEPKTIKTPKVRNESRTQPKKRLLDANKIHQEIRKLDENEITAYSVVIRRSKSGRSSYLKDYTSLMNIMIRNGVDIYE